MQPQTEDPVLLATYDPVAAYGILLGIPRIPIVANSVASFSSFALNQIPLATALDVTLAARTWLDNITYSVNPRGQFSGNVFQPQYAAFLRQNTGISIRVTVLSGPKYLVCQNFTPLENFVNVFASRWPAGWPLYKQQTIKTEFMLTDVPGGDSTNLNAYDVTVTWNGWQFIDPCLDEMSGDEAWCKMRDMGIELPCKRPCERRAPGG